MTRSLFACLLIFTCACSSGPQARPETPSTEAERALADAVGESPAPREGEPGEGGPASLDEPGAPDLAAHGDAARAPSRALRVSSSGEWALDIWSDPDFQERFTRSYLSETEIEPAITLPEREVMEEVVALLAEERLDEAIELLEDERSEASSAVVDYTLANLYFQEDRLDEALGVYETAVEKFPKFRRAWQNLGLIHVRSGDFEAASQALIRVLELGGSDGVAYGLLGFAHSNLERHMAAESAYRMAVMLDPRTRDWQMGLALALFRQERFADAATLCGNLIDEDPGNPDLWMLQANAFIGLGQALKAAENYEFVDSLGASTVESLAMLGDIYTNEQLFEPAVAAYQRALTTDAEAMGDRLLRAARVLTSQGALSEASLLLTDLESARAETLTVDERKDILRLKARLAVAEGAGDEEVAVLEELVTLDPLDGEALILIGKHHRREGDFEQAAFYFERAAGIEGFEAKAKVDKAQLLVAQGRYGEALPLLRRAQAIDPRASVQEYLDQVERVASRAR